MFLDRQVEMGFPFSAALGKSFSEGLGIPLAIYNGDTVCVRTNGSRLKLRLLGIDTPEECYK